MFNRNGFNALICLFLGFSACEDSTFVAELAPAKNDKRTSEAVDVSEETRERNPRIDETADARGPDGRLYPRPGIGDKSPTNPNGTITKYEDVEPIVTSCDGKNDVSQGIINISKPRNHHVEAMLKGEFCPDATNKLNILFIIDFSASMGRHLGADGITDSPGNDPQDAQGLCGRYGAVRAIIDSVKNDAGASDQIEIGMLPFSGNIVQPFIMQPESLDQFDGNVSADKVCRHVIQGPQYNSPGGIDDPSVALSAGPSTNYAAAFDAASNILRTARGRNVVYFITDGEPTAPSINPLGAAATSANLLRRSIPNLTFNSILLGSRRPEAERVLTQVTGSQERVRYAASAEDLAKEITSFPDAEIDVNNPKNGAIVNVEPYAPKPVKFFSFKEISQGVYSYQLQPIVLLGLPGKVVDNVVTVEAHGKDGTTHTTQLIIRYKQE